MLPRDLPGARRPARLSRRGFLRLALSSAVLALSKVGGAPSAVKADPAPIWYQELEEDEPPDASAAVASQEAAALANPMPLPPMVAPETGALV